jgi:hypothetical protein
MHQTPGENRLARVSVGTVFGATAALLVGILAAMAGPAGDAVTKAVPLGAAIGAVFGYRNTRG